MLSIERQQSWKSDIVWPEVTLIDLLVSYMAVATICQQTYFQLPLFDSSFILGLTQCWGETAAGILVLWLETKSCLLLVLSLFQEQQISYFHFLKVIPLLKDVICHDHITIVSWRADIGLIALIKLSLLLLYKRVYDSIWAEIKLDFSHCLGLYLNLSVPWWRLIPPTTAAVCRQKTFQFGDPPSGSGKLALQKAASPQVGPSGVQSLPFTLTLLLRNADEDTARPSILNKTLSRRIRERASLFCMNSVMSFICVSGKLSAAFQQLGMYKWENVATKVFGEKKSEF